MPAHYEYSPIRDELVRRVADGETTPWWAEAEAAAKGIGPLAHEAGFDPLTHKDARRWSLPMVLSWIIWRSCSSVCDAWPEYRRHTKIWWGPSEQKCVVDPDHGHENTQLIGDGRYRTYLSWALARPPEVSLSDVMTKAGHEVGASAQSDLWERLNAGEILAQGMPYGDKFPRNILETEWNSAEPLGWDRHEGWSANDIGTATDVTPRYREVSVPREDVLRIWPPLALEADPMRQQTLGTADASAGQYPEVADPEALAVKSLADFLKSNPEAKKPDALRFLAAEKIVTGTRGFNNRIWPDARKAAGLSRRGSAGRPRKK